VTFTRVIEVVSHTRRTDVHHSHSLFHYHLSHSSLFFFFFFFNDTATTEIYTLSLHDALPISECHDSERRVRARSHAGGNRHIQRSEEHTSELQSRRDLVCRLLLEKKKIIKPHTLLIIPAGALI